MAEEFYQDYDRLIRIACPGYDRCLELMVSSIFPDVESVLDLGSGTGNLISLIIRRRTGVRVYGLELQQSLVDIANSRLSSKNVSIKQGNILDFNWPKAQGIVSSLVIHHFTHAEKEAVFRRIFEISRFFVYFDLFKGRNKAEEKMFKDYLFHHMRQNGLSEEMILKGKESMEEHDKPMTVKEQERMFRKIGFSYKLLHLDHGFGVYLCTRNE